MSVNSSFNHKIIFIATSYIVFCTGDKIRINGKFSPDVNRIMAYLKKCKDSDYKVTTLYEYADFLKQHVPKDGIWPMTFSEFYQKAEEYRQKCMDEFNLKQRLELIANYKPPEGYSTEISLERLMKL